MKARWGGGREFPRFLRHWALVVVVEEWEGRAAPLALRDRYRQELRRQNLHSWPRLGYWHQQLNAPTKSQSPTSHPSPRVAADCSPRQHTANTLNTGVTWPAHTLSGVQEINKGSLLDGKHTSLPPQACKILWLRQLLI